MCRPLRALASMESQQNNPADQSFTEAERRMQQVVHEVAMANKIFSSIDVDYGFELTPDFRENIRILGQLYETVQRYLTGAFRKSEAFYPHTEDIYSDLHLYKRTINDKNKMPVMGDFEKLTFILAAQAPPFMHIVRELYVDINGSLNAITRYAAPTEKHPDKVHVAYQSVIRNSGAAVADYINKNSKKYEWEDGFYNVASLDEVDLKQGRVDQILKVLFIKKLTEVSMDNRTLMYMKKINNNIQRRLLMPLLQHLLREKTIISISCKDLRAAGIPAAEKYSDLLLINDDQYLKRRYEAVCAMLEQPWCRKYQDEHNRKTLQLKRGNDEISADEYYGELAKHMFESFRDKPDLPEKLLDPVVEVLKISQWKIAFEKERKQTEEKNALREIAERLIKHNNVYRAKQGRKLLIPEYYLKMFLSNKVPGILAATDPYDSLEGGTPDPANYDGIYLIYMDRKVTGAAIDAAIDAFEKTQDTFLLGMLENILRLGRVPESKLKEYVAPAYLEKFRRALKESYVQHLPWWHRIWLLISSSQISDAKMTRLRESLRRDDLARLRKKSAQHEKDEVAEGKRQVREVAKERMRQGSSGADNAPEGQVAEAIAAYLDGVWKTGVFPRAADVLRGMPADKREAAKKALSMVDVGAASMKAILKIPINGEDPVYGGAEYLKANRDDILERCSEKLQTTQAIQVDGKTMTRKVQVKDQQVYEGIVAFIRAYL